MTAFLIIIAMILVIDAKTSENGTIFPDYLARGRTDAIKGLFIMLVFLRHLKDYYEYSSPYDKFFLFFNKSIGQLLVTLFLFYSGYGVMEAIQKRGFSYVKNMPYRRIFKVVLHFDIVVCIYTVMHIYLERDFPARQFLKSLVMWDGMGNSNWYIFTMVSMYILTFLAFFVVRNNYYIGAILLTILTCGYILVMYRFKDPWWYNTALCYPLGVWYSLVKEPIEKMFQKSTFFYGMAMCSIGVVYVYSAHYHFTSLICYMLWALAFTMMVVFGTMKIRFDNGILRFLGSHLFSFYIMQRFVMQLMAEYYPIAKRPYLYCIACFMGLIACGLIIDKVFEKLDKILF